MRPSGRSAQATKSSRYLSACGAPPLPHARDGCGVIPTSATGWKYDPSAAPGSSPRASNCAAMYLTARRPPRVAGARPLTWSSARYLRCASIAAALGATTTAAGGGGGGGGTRERRRGGGRPGRRDDEGGAAHRAGSTVK